MLSIVTVMAIQTVIVIGIVLSGDTGVCEQNIPPEMNPLGNISLTDTRSGAGEQLF